MAQDGRKGRWVLILDNVDDDHFLRRAPFISQIQPSATEIARWTGHYGRISPRVRMDP